MKLTRATLPQDNKPSCEREVTLAQGQSLPRGSSLSRVHVNRPLDWNSIQLDNGKVKSQSFGAKMSGLNDEACDANVEVSVV